MPKLAVTIIESVAGSMTTTDGRHAVLLGDQKFRRVVLSASLVSGVALTR